MRKVIILDDWESPRMEFVIDYVDDCVKIVNAKYDDGRNIPESIVDDLYEQICEEVNERIREDEG